MRDLLPDEAEELLKGRVQVINLWRPIRGPLRDAPLAVCDARTVDAEDLVPSDLVYRDRVGETYSVTYNPAHHWYYVPEMRRDEALLLKIADTKTDVARALYAAHLVHRPDDAARRVSAREHRAAHPRLPPELSTCPALARRQRRARKFVVFIPDRALDRDRR